MTEPLRVTFAEFYGPGEPQSGDPDEAFTAWIERDPISSHLFANTGHRPTEAMILVREDGEETFAVLPAKDYRELIESRERWKRIVDRTMDLARIVSEVNAMVGRENRELRGGAAGGRVRADEYDA